MYKCCLACGEPKTEYRTLLTGMFVVVTWTFAAALFVLILQHRLIF